MREPPALSVAEYFDGARRHEAGPYTLHFDGGGVLLGVEPAAPGTVADAPFAMPSLVEGHAHLVLDGGVLDSGRRGAYLKSGVDAMLETGRRNLRQARAAGVGLVRDAGDRWGINHALREECGARDGIRVRSCGTGLRRPGRYGGFLAREVAADGDIVAAVRESASDCDHIKVVLTGIIDFAKGEVPGEPQFDRDALALVIRTARECGRPTLAHCSGLAGLEVAAAAGVDSIEHGFFMTRPVLERMAERGIAWVPTFSPVRFQHAEPGHAGWSPDAVRVIGDILESHRAHVALAHSLGIPIVCGSDAGSQGVEHGRGLIDEMTSMLELGLDMRSVLESATSLPRRQWGAASNDVVAGARPDLLVLAESPFRDRSALRRPLAVGSFADVSAELDKARVPLEGPRA